MKIKYVNFYPFAYRYNNKIAIFRWRKIQELGLSPQYKKKDTAISKYLSYIFGLPFLRPEDVGECFGIDFASIQPKNQAIVTFADYLVDNYIAEDALFPLHIWAEHSSSLQNTTNACESFHSKYNSNFYSAHPNIWIFINVLLNCQIDSYIKQRSTKIVQKFYDPASLERQEFINSLIELLKNETITVMEFVKAVSYRFNIAKK